MNQFNVIHYYEPTEPSTEWNSQPTPVHFKFRTSPPKTSPVVFSIMVRLNHHAIDNGDVQVYHSAYPFESAYDPVPNPDTTPIKSIDDNEMDQLL